MRTPDFSIGSAMQLSTQAEDGALVVTVMAERIDADAALAFKEAMRKSADQAEENVVLDLGQVNFIDSSGLGALVGTMKHLAPERALLLAGMSPPVAKVFELTRMDSVFRLYPTPQDALLAVQSRGM